jgi:DNA-binding transcriptional LysR family regulator
MELTYLKTFCGVAARQSITKAADDLGYAQSTVTMQIQKLEREYGVTLFERYGRKLRLTPPGESLLKIATKMIDLYTESKETIANHVSGRLTIGTMDSLAAYYLPPYLQQLRKLFPDLSILLQPEPETTILSKVKEGEFDIGFLLDHKHSDSTLSSTVIRAEPLVLIAPPDHPLTQLTKVELNYLIGLEFIVAEESCNYRIMFEQVLKEHGIAVRIGFELGNPEAIKQCVRNGLGIALLPRIVVEEEIHQGTLVVLPLTHPDLQFDLQFFIHPKKWMSKPLLKFIELISEG